jgi:hypothetical protein
VIFSWACKHTDQEHMTKGLCKSCYKAITGKKRYHARKQEMGLVAWRDYRHEMRLRRRYHLPWEQYQTKLAAQNYACICGKPFNRDGGKSSAPHVDHNHLCCSGDTSCGKCVRGILCFRCNSVLGFLESEPHLLPDYLKVYLAKYPLSRL